MAAGLEYTSEIVLGDYPCDISSIVRYRGGFNIAEETITNFKGYKFPIFTPLMLNLTKHEACIADTLFPFPSTWATEAYISQYAFAYNAFTLEDGVSVTAILHADEISFTALVATQYYNASSEKYKDFDAYALLLEDSASRTTLMNQFNKTNTYIWA